jgi:hypothetical protein
MVSGSRAACEFGVLGVLARYPRELRQTGNPDRLCGLPDGGEQALAVGSGEVVFDF